MGDKDQKLDEEDIQYEPIDILGVPVSEYVPVSYKQSPKSVVELEDDAWKRVEETMKLVVKELGTAPEDVRRTLRANWSPEMSADMRAFNSLDEIRMLQGLGPLGAETDAENEAWKNVEEELKQQEKK